MSNAKETNIIAFKLQASKVIDPNKVKIAPVVPNDERVLKFRNQSIYSLIKYTAYFMDLPLTEIEAMVKTKFGVDNISKLNGSEYEDVMKFLLDLQDDAITLTGRMQSQLLLFTEL
jgi:hypothetical protein